MFENKCQLTIRMIKSKILLCIGRYKLIDENLYKDEVGKDNLIKFNKIFTS